MIRLSVSTFVPKPHTAFQWAAQESEATITERQEVLKNGLNKKGVQLSWHDPGTSLLEAVLARGDRRLGKAIHRAWELGCKFDGWSEHFKLDSWLRAFSEVGIEPSFYAYRERSIDEVLPWSHIDSGISPDFLKLENRRAGEGKVTPDCRVDACNACGLEETAVCRQKFNG
jgi:hypothetical protein